MGRTKVALLEGRL